MPASSPPHTPSSVHHGTTTGPDEDAEDRVLLETFDQIQVRQSLQERMKQRKRLVLGLGLASSLAMLIAILATRNTHKESIPLKPYQRTDYNASFFVIGDWGRKGIPEQRTAADMMATLASASPPDFIISTGDNFYESGLKSSWDHTFKKSFLDVYNQPSLRHLPWFAVLGNHDYGEKIDPRVNKQCAANSLEACPAGCCYSPVWQFTDRLHENDGRWHCHNGTYTVPGTYKLPGGRGEGMIDILFIDTNPFIDKYQKQPFAENAGGLSSQDREALRQSIIGSLKAMKGPWKVVVGHHPVYSYGGHCKKGADCDNMAFLGKLMEEAGVHLYLCGHDHDLQYIKKDKERVHYVVSGAGSKVRSGEFTEKELTQMKYGNADNPGFVSVQVFVTHLEVSFYVSGQSSPAYNFTIT